MNNRRTDRLGQPMTDSDNVVMHLLGKQSLLYTECSDYMTNIASWFPADILAVAVYVVSKPTESDEKTGHVK